MCLCWTLVTSSAFFWGPRKRAENIETSKKKASTFFCSIWGFRHVECWKVRFLPPLRTGFGKGPEENQCKRWEVLAHVEHQKMIRAQFYQTPFLNPGLPFTDPNPILKFFFGHCFKNYQSMFHSHPWPKPELIEGLEGIQEMFDAVVNNFGKDLVCNL